jgi:hypothetical protein
MLRGMAQATDALLAAVERLPAATLELDDARRTAGVRVGARLVARIDLWHGRVLVDAPGHLIPTLRRVFPSSRPAVDGIAFDLADAQARSDALAAIRRRVDVERVSGQSREASP